MLSGHREMAAGASVCYLVGSLFLVRGSWLGVFRIELLSRADRSGSASATGGGPKRKRFGYGRGTEAEALRLREGVFEG